LPNKRRGGGLAINPRGEPMAFGSNATLAKTFFCPHSIAGDLTVKMGLVDAGMQCDCLVGVMIYSEIPRATMRNLST
jgi:hypothetical protein